MSDREFDIQSVCKRVLETAVTFEECPNSYDRNRCIFCGQEARVHYKAGQIVSVDELEHEPDCAYLIAKDLATGF
jgi:hypothetical protein